MKIVNIMGGLGNQMFQYALAIALMHKHPNEDILIDASGFHGYPLHNGYELNRIFNVLIPQASFRQQASLCYPFRNYKMWQIVNRLFPRRNSVIYESKDMMYNPDVLNIDASAYYLGYWQTEKYFKDIRPLVLDAFKFPEIAQDNPNYRIIKLLDNKNSVGIHVRRGDYVKIEATQGICTIDYYKKAIEKITRKATPELFLIFSDDIEWCRENLSDYFDDIQIIYVDWNKGDDSYRDMHLMSLCCHNIIANSSFSWWGAWLNKNYDKIVISPSRWMNGGGWVDMIPNDWIKCSV